jgi:transposase InsO family protein
MSRQTSPSTQQPYGVTRVLRVWELPRSTFYVQRERQAHPTLVRRGRPPIVDDATLLAHIRSVIAESPFHGEGHRKIWARLRVLKQVRTSMRRVLRVMRAADLLSPARHPEPVNDHPHDGTIVTDQPNVMWGTDAPAAVTLVEGAVTIFAAIDHCTAECVGIHAAKHGDRFEALEPLRQGVRDHFGALAPAVAAGLALRHDHGSVDLSGDFQAEITFFGMTSSPAFVRQPEGNGCIERFFRTLKEQLLWVRHFSTIEELRQALLAFKETYNREWLIARLGYRSPVQVRQAFAVRPAA